MVKIHGLRMKPRLRALARMVIPVGCVAALHPSITPQIALVSGIVVASSLGNPWPRITRTIAHRTLTLSVIGLGATMNLGVVARVGLHGVGYTAVGIACALILGAMLGRRLAVGRDLSLLVSVGTAICGGSAIAAVAPTIRAKDHDVSIALVTVFLLNAIALVLFPAIGHRLHMRPDAFGLWCALAIHDTSSVVGAASQYGERALQIATAAKLARALWIVPITFALGARRRRDVDGSHDERPTRPWFIAGFVFVAALRTWVPSLHAYSHIAARFAHRLLALTLFLTGLAMSREALRTVGVRPLVQGLVLWAVLASTTLGAIVAGWVT
jgi:uncharacterized integral membrane protein (TIGR00698 family)